MNCEKARDLCRRARLHTAEARELLECPPDPIIGAAGQIPEIETDRYPLSPNEASQQEH